jgi:hypothetical protein
VSCRKFRSSWVHVLAAQYIRLQSPTSSSW